MTHDPHLVELCADRLWVVRDGGCHRFEGDMNDYRDELIAQRRATRSRARAQRNGSANGDASQDPAAAKADRKASRRAGAAAPMPMSHSA